MTRISVTAEAQAVRHVLGMIARSLPPSGKPAAIWLDHPANLYITEKQARAYISLMKDARYSHPIHDPVKSLLQANSRLVLSGLTPPVDILDLGPGYPDKTFPLLDYLAGAGIPYRYVPVDISSYFLQMAASSVSRYGVPVLPLHCLFEDLPLRLREPPFDRKASKLVLLGLTFMNYRPSRIVRLLRRICGSLDAVVVATQLTNSATPLEIAAPYQTPGAYRFNFTVPALLNIPRDAIKYEVHFRRGRIEMGFRTLTTITLKCGLTLRQDTRLITALSYRYSRAGFRDVLGKQFSSVRLLTGESSGVAVAKCRIALGRGR